MRKLVAIAAYLVLLSFLWPSAPSNADSLTNPATSFLNAKKTARDVIYADRRITFYCSCAYTPNPTGASGKIDVVGCSYANEENKKRGKVLEWEHVMPAARIGSHRDCWAKRELFPACFKKTGKLVSLSEQNLIDCATKEGIQSSLCQDLFVCIYILLLYQNWVFCNTPVLLF